MIVWLASYPKSGNTWVRIFLNSLLFSDNNDADINNLKIGQFPNRSDFEGITENIDDINEFAKNCIAAQSIINLSDKITILKTHHANWKSYKSQFTDKTNTLGVLYIVRDPRNVITSLKNHYNFNNYEDSLKFLLNDKNVIGVKNSNKEMDLPHIISSWKNHYNSWKKMDKNYLLIKYENLLENPILEFKKITNFLEKLFNKKFDEKKIINSINNSDFSKLKFKEKTTGFIESQKEISGKPITFFNLGPENNWKKLLNRNFASTIEEKFYKEMLELGYL